MNEEVFKTEFSDHEISSVSIDTTAVYKLYSSWTGDYKFNSKTKENFYIANEVKDIYGNKSASAEFVRIHKNSKLDFYYYPNSDTLDCNLFEKNSNNIGIYDIHNDQIYTKRFLGIGHSGKLIRGKVLVKEDTLHLIEKRLGRTHHNKYIKTECSNAK